MTLFLQLALALAVIIAAAKAGGYISYRLGQPSVLGELIVGLILGPTVINLFHQPYFSHAEALAETISLMAELGVMLLMFIAGLELHLSDLAKSAKVSALAGTLGVALPLGLGIVLGLAFSLDLKQSIHLGLVLSATSVSISAQTLMEMNMLRTRVGIGLLGAAVFDDILVVLGLSIFTALALAEMSNGLLSVAGIFLRMILFLGIGTLLGFRLLPRWSRKVSKLPISQGVMAFVLIAILLYGWAAEELGSMAAITGAFLAGLVLSQSELKERIENGMVVIAYGFFVPIFFINVGLHANLRELTGASLWIFLAMTIVAILGKVVGSGAGGLLAGFNRREALQLGIGMVSRGEVGLIVASVGMRAGLISRETFSAIIGMVIVTTLFTPPMLRWAYRIPGPADKTGGMETGSKEKPKPAQSAAGSQSPHSTPSSKGEPS